MARRASSAPFAFLQGTEILLAPVWGRWIRGRVGWRIRATLRLAGRRTHLTTRGHSALQVLGLVNNGIVDELPLVVMRFALIFLQRFPRAQAHHPDDGTSAEGLALPEGLRPASGELLSPAARAAGRAGVPCIVGACRALWSCGSPSCSRAPGHATKRILRRRLSAHGTGAERAATQSAA